MHGAKTCAATDYLRSALLATFGSAIPTHSRQQLKQRKSSHERPNTSENIRSTSHVAGALSRHPNKGRSLRKELQAIQWQLVDKDGRSVNLRGPLYTPSWCHASEGIVFDGRDNEAQKLSYFQIRMKAELFIKVLPCAS